MKQQKLFWRVMSVILSSSLISFFIGAITGNPILWIIGMGIIGASMMIVVINAMWSFLE